MVLKLLQLLELPGRSSRWTSFQPTLCRPVSQCSSPAAATLRLQAFWAHATASESPAICSACLCTVHGAIACVAGGVPPYLPSTAPDQQVHCLECCSEGPSLTLFPGVRGPWRTWVLQAAAGSRPGAGGDLTGVPVTIQVSLPGSRGGRRGGRLRSKRERVAGGAGLQLLQ